jgi:iron complex transport system ATP-binding protein
MLTINNLYFERKDFKIKVPHLKLITGEKVALLGENGSGKSTLFNILTGLITNIKGSIAYNGQLLNKISILNRARIFAYLPQFFDVIFNFTVFDIVLFGRFPYLWKHNITKDDRTKTDAMLKKFNLEDLKHKKWEEISGGEKKRTIIAKTLNQETDIIFFDEPMSMLDIKHQIFFLQLISSFDKLIITSAHNINLAKDYFDRFIFLKKGSIIADLKRNEINEEILSKTFDVNVKSTNNFFIFS